MNQQRSKWDFRFLKLAEFYAQWSKDPSTKVGAVIAKGNRQISQGYNGYPSGVQDVGLENREEKYRKVLHAELNAVLFAKQDLSGCTIYVWPFAPCSTCAGIIIQSRISRVVTLMPTAELQERWSESNEIAARMFGEAGVILDIVDMGA